MDVKLSKDKRVAFYDDTHSYILLENNAKFKSVTQTIHSYSPPFDPTGEITERFAIENGLSVAEVKEYWRIENHVANIYGTAVHLSLENYINFREMTSKRKFRWMVEQFAEIKFEGKLKSEALVYSEEHMLAGQVDLTEALGNNTINIWDFKTNKELMKANEYGTKMLKDFWYLDDCNFVHYEIQLSIYARLYELKGMKINKLTVIYFNRYTKKMELHECRYMRKEVDIMLANRLKEIGK